MTQPALVFETTQWRNIPQCVMDCCNNLKNEIVELKSKIADIKDQTNKTLINVTQIKGEQKQFQNLVKDQMEDQKKRITAMGVDNEQALRKEIDQFTNNVKNFQHKLQTEQQEKQSSDESLLLKLQELQTIQENQDKKFNGQITILNEFMFKGHQTSMNNYLQSDIRFPYINCKGIVQFDRRLSEKIHQLEQQLTDLTDSCNLKANSEQTDARFERFNQMFENANSTLQNQQNQALQNLRDRLQERMKQLCTQLDTKFEILTKELAEMKHSFSREIEESERRIELKNTEQTQRTLASLPHENASQSTARVNELQKQFQESEKSFTSFQKAMQQRFEKQERKMKLQQDKMAKQQKGSSRNVIGDGQKKAGSFGGGYKLSQAQPKPIAEANKESDAHLRIDSTLETPRVASLNEPSHQLHNRQSAPIPADEDSLCQVEDSNSKVVTKQRTTRLGKMGKEGSRAVILFEQEMDLVKWARSKNVQIHRVQNQNQKERLEFVTRSIQPREMSELEQFASPYTAINNNNNVNNTGVTNVTKGMMNRTGGLNGGVMVGRSPVGHSVATAAPRKYRQEQRDQSSRSQLHTRQIRQDLFTADAEMLKRSVLSPKTHTVAQSLDEQQNLPALDIRFQQL